MNTNLFLLLFVGTLVTVPWLPLPWLVFWTVITLVLTLRGAPQALRVILRPWFLGSTALMALAVFVLLPGVPVAQRGAWIARFLLRAWILILWLQLLRHQVSPYALVRLLRKTPVRSWVPLVVLSLFLLPRLMEEVTESWNLYRVWMGGRRWRSVPRFLMSVVQQAVRIAEDLTLALVLVLREES